MFKFLALAKVFISLYLLKLSMDQLDTMCVVRYCSEIIFCTIVTHLYDLVKVTYFEIL